MTLVLALLGGCANTRNIQLTENFWHEKNQKVSIAAFESPKPLLHEVGGQGLIDLAITSAMNRNINAYLNKIDTSWYEDIIPKFTVKLKKQNIFVIQYPKKIDGRKSYQIALAQAGDSKLLTINLQALGARREYSMGFIPTRAPEAYCKLEGQLIDPKDKKVWWRHEVEIIQPIEGDWDQPPSYPNLTHALNTAIDEAQNEMLDSFFNGS